ncbi:unnamed protein product, partial [Urochloa humidicola]
RSPTSAHHLLSRGFLSSRRRVSERRRSSSIPSPARASTRVELRRTIMADFSRESCPSVKNILLLDSEGKRVAVKYFSDDWPTNASKLSYEKSIFTKTLKTNARTDAEITLFDGYIVVYKFVHDLHFFVTAGDDENELILASVLNGFCDSVGLLLRGDVEKRTALENLDLILLCIDEIIDGGIILETDANSIAGKVATNAADGSVPFSEQTISQALATAREHFARSLLK